MLSRNLLLLAALVLRCGASLWGRVPTDPLPESHPLVARDPQAGPYTPEQIQLSFAGPGAVSVSWVTWPTVPSKETRRLSTVDFRRTFQSLFASNGQHEGRQQQRQQQQEKKEKKNKRKKKHTACDDMLELELRSSIRWGYERGELTNVEEGTFSCYSTVAYDSGALHRVVIGVDGGPIVPSASVFYQVGDAAQDVWSDEFQFTMSPPIGSFPYKLGVIGDLGQTKHSVQTLEHLRANRPDSLMLVGDLSYADGYQPRWDTWGRMMSNDTSRLVVQYTEGNHEIEPSEDKYGTADFLAYTKRFDMPYEQSGSSSPLYYSYDLAGAHIVMLGSYADFDEGSEQYAWLAKDLAKVSRTSTPWLVLAMHVPWYNSNHNHAGEGEKMRKSIEPLVNQHGVDIVFSGHVHAYERSHPVRNLELNECGPVYVNIGDGGNREGLDHDYYQQPAWSAVREPSYGHGVLDLFDETKARFSWFRNVDGVGEATDVVELNRSGRENCLNTTYMV